MANDGRSPRDDPICIVGMGCRLPGDVKSPSQLWDLLEQEKSAQSDVPTNRFDISKWYHPDAKRHGSVASMGGYFLSHDDSFRAFDPSFFGINPLEAATMDPQQRKLLEVVYEALDSAGTTLRDVSGSQTACYVGAFTNDMGRILSRDLEYYPDYAATGTDLTILSNRINYVFNLKGPSLTVDTACSSSLYALHLACQSLVLGDCSAAIVGGTNIVMDVRHQLMATKLGILSPTSTCHTFDEAADGFGRGDGITAIYLKKLSDAIANGDPVRAIIRATAINTNGRGHGITHPGYLGQQEVIRKAHMTAGLHPRSTGYFECHGTGTPVGDPIEVAAIGSIFAADRTPEDPLLLGALKPNIGHGEGASGISSVLKVVMSLEKALIPATIGIRKLNPALDMVGGRLRIVTKLQAWPDYSSYRRAGVNSFGYGGANAHVILDASECYLNSIGHALPRSWTWLESLRRTSVQESRDHLEPVDSFADLDKVSQPNEPALLAISSAHDEKSLDKFNGDVIELVGPSNARDVCYTLARRSRLRHRAFAILDDDAPGSWSKGESSSTVPRLAFIFTGQGAQWPQMGLDLIRRFPVVQKTFQSLQAAMNNINDGPDWTLVEALSQPSDTSSDSSIMTSITVSVTLCTAIQIAIVDLLRSWNVQGEVVLGHSSGEAAAAYTAGLLTAEEAVTTSYYRALAMVRKAEPGAMLAVGLSLDEAHAYLESRDDLYVACCNSPWSTTISGKNDAIHTLEKDLSAVGKFARLIKSSGYGNHSPLVDEAAIYFQSEFKHSLPPPSDLIQRQGRAVMYSCITGSKVTAGDLGIEYWSHNISRPVIFDQTAQSLFKSHPDIDHVIEIGPHPALAGPMREIKQALRLSDDKLCHMPSLIRGRNGPACLMRLAGGLFIDGCEIDTKAVNSADDTDATRNKPRLIVDLPGYAWARETLYWTEDRISNQLNFRENSRHDLLGSRIPGSSATAPLWRNELRLIDVPWIADHQIGQDILFPASCYLAMAIESAKQAALENGDVPVSFTLKDVTIIRPLILSRQSDCEIMLQLVALERVTQSGVRTFRFEIFSNKMVHAHGTVACSSGSPVSFCSSIEQLTEAPEEIDWYGKLQPLGLQYGPSFKTLHHVYRTDSNSISAQIALNSTRGMMVQESQYAVHPATLDGCLQAAFIATQNRAIASPSRVFLPSRITSMTISTPSHDQDDFAIVRGHGAIRGLRQTSTKFALISSGGETIVDANVIFLSVEGGFASVEELHPQPYQRMCWTPRQDILDGSKAEDKSFAESDRANEMIVDAQHTFTTGLNHPLWLIHDEGSPQKSLQRLISSLHPFSRSAMVSDLSSVPRGASVVLLAQLDMTNMDEHMLRDMQIVFQRASHVIWTTCSDDPAMFIMHGMMKVLETEYPNLSVFCVDIQDSERDMRVAASVILRILDKASSGLPVIDKHIFIRAGVPHTCQYVLDEDANANDQSFHQVMTTEGKYEPGLALDMRRVGKSESAFFKRSSFAVSQSHSTANVLIRPSLYGMTQREARSLLGKEFSTSLSRESLGDVVRVTGHSALKVGQQVFCLASGCFDSELEVPEAHCVPAGPDSSAVGQLAAYCIAVQALVNTARVRERDRVLIHCGSDLLTVVAAQIAQQAGAKVAVIYQTEDQKEFLMQYCGLHDQNLALEHDLEEWQSYWRSNGLQFDLVLSTMAAHTLGWVEKHMMRTGRIVLASDPSTDGLRPNSFSKETAVSRIDLDDILEKDHKLIASLLSQWGAYSINIPPPHSFNISEIGVAAEVMSREETFGRAAIACHPEMMVPIQRQPQDPLHFRNDANYLLIGCLGGLGRSLAMWMRQRGARHFIFVSRSGDEKPEAASMVKDLRSSPCCATVTIVKGDVTLREDVDSAMKVAVLPIKGIVQAAAVFGSTHFSEMTLDDFNTVLQPKVRGTKNLHEASVRLGLDLDFFVMTSSTIGILGPSTQSHYAAANAYLDAMARHRRQMSLPASSLSLGMVKGAGHVHENNHIADLMYRRGAYDISESEYLQAMELACRPQSLSRSTENGLLEGKDIYDQRVIITGIDPTRVGVVEGRAPTWIESDGRLSRLHKLVRSRCSESTAMDQRPSATSNESQASNVKLKQILASRECDEMALRAEVQSMLLHKMSTLVRISKDKLMSSLGRPLSDLGMDSILSSDLRSWLWKELGAELTFLQVLDSTNTLSSLVDTVRESIR